MLSLWWWVALAVAGVGAGLLFVAQRALQAERAALGQAATLVDRAREALANPE